MGHQVEGPREKRAWVKPNKRAWYYTEHAQYFTKGQYFGSSARTSFAVLLIGESAAWEEPAAPSFLFL